MLKLIFISWLASIAFALAGAMLTIDWLVGCGETYIDAQGNTHRNECIFLNLK